MTNNLETPEVSIVIPVYNEEAVLSLLFERLYPVLQNLKHRYEVIFVDDGSQDNTGSILEGLAGRNPRISLIRNGTNRGKGCRNQREKCPLWDRQKSSQETCSGLAGGGTGDFPRRD